MTTKRTRVLLITILAIFILLLAVAAGTYFMVGSAVRCQLPERASPEAGWTARTLVSGGLERCYYIYAPPTYDVAQPLPVVFSFHGFLSNPESQALISGWHKLAADEGFLVVYPEGQKFPQRWDSGETWGDLNVDDVQFFRDMLGDLSSRAAVDLSRVYVNGFSNGGGMTVRLGCEAADLIAAIGTVSAAVVATGDCNSAQQLPLMAFHGAADPVVNYEGGDMRSWLLRWAARVTDAPTYFVGFEDWVAVWADGNGCDLTPEAIAPRGDVSGVRYTDCYEGADVVRYTIADGGHAWPGGWPIPLVGKTSKDIDATAEMWRFFQEYTLEDQP
jgi:polyhydroxybutyrate depolymerase